MYYVTNLTAQIPFYENESKEKVIKWVDTLLSALKGFNFLSELNEMQAQATPWPPIGNGETPVPFDNKYTLPLYFLNLVLQPHKLKIVENLK